MHPNAPPSKNISETRTHNEEAGTEKQRVKAYIDNVLLALNQLRDKNVPGRAKELVKLAKLYVDDAIYYLEQGDIFTSLAAIAYAEGLLDSLRWLGIIDFEWKPLSSLVKRPVVVVAGTFDILHPGHIKLFREAWKLGRVYVIVARDSNVKRFKGREPIVPEEQRLEIVGSIRYVSSAILGSENDILEPITKLKPDVILLGPDQWASEDWLRKSLEERGINAKIIRLSEKATCKLCSTTSIACRVINVFPRDHCDN